MVKPKTARVRRGTQPPTFIHKNATTSELLDQITSPCIAEQTMLLHRGMGCPQSLQKAHSKQTQS